jgi:ketosteroid isomerase-like protein
MIHAARHVVLSSETRGSADSAGAAAPPGCLAQGRLPGRACIRARLLATLFAALAIALPSLAQTPRTPAEIVDAFHQALSFGDTAKALSMLSRELVVYEFGLVDASLQAYAFQHLPGDMNLASQTQWTLQTRRMGGTGDQRWVLSNYRVTGTGAKGEPLDQVTLETIILQKIGDDFRIAHIHWSTAAPTTPTPAAPAR